MSNVLALDRDKVIRKAKLRLGFPKWCLELTEEHFIDGLDDTDRWFLAWMGNVREEVVSYASAQQEIPVVADCVEVFDVALPSRSTDYAAALNPLWFSEDGSYPTYFLNHGGGSFLGDIHQTLAHREMAGRILSAEREWEWVQHKRVIRLFPKGVPTSDGGTLVYWYTTCDINYMEMTPYQQDLYIRYYRATMKEMLGRIRSKFAEYPGAAGPVRMDGPELLREAREELAELREEVLAIPIKFTTG